MSIKELKLTKLSIMELRSLCLSGLLHWAQSLVVVERPSVCHAARRAGGWPRRPRRLASWLSWPVFKPVWRGDWGVRRIALGSRGQHAGSGPDRGTSDPHPPGVRGVIRISRSQLDSSVGLTRRGRAR
jgi:hypothetical protein